MGLITYSPCDHHVTWHNVDYHMTYSIAPSDVAYPSNIAISSDISTIADRCCYDTDAIRRETKYIIVPRNCPNCGAPGSDTKSECPYCGTPYTFEWR